ncbi:MAG: glycosyltransferase family 4 protein, partial [Bacteroidales bacterium]|nr:glycosyltransferase family 4 protein [Bacteroidales bacterium]
MKVLHLVANDSWGGGEQYVYDLVARLCSEEWCEPIVVCRNTPIVVNNFASLSIRVFKLKMNGYLDLRSILALSHILKDLKDDCIIHAHDFKRAFIALMARKRAAVNKNIRVIMTRHLVRPAKNGVFEKFVYRNIDSILFVSQMAKDFFLSSTPKIDNNKCRVVLSGVKDRKCDSLFVRTKYQIANNEFVIMYHGRIVPEKG